MELVDIDATDVKLIEAAVDVIRRNYRADRHSVGAAVLCSSGKTYAGVNLDSCGYGPCAEFVAVGCAVSAGERRFLSIVAVNGASKDYPVLPPCGNCRQMLVDYCPDVMVILEHEGKLVKTKAGNLIPVPYSSFGEGGTTA